MNKILIALDIDDSAIDIATTGHAWAKNNSAEVILLHVIDEPAYYSDLSYSPVLGFSGLMADDLVNFTESIGKTALQFLQQVKAQLKDDSILIQTASGDFEEAVINTIRELHADLLVIGNHSRRGLSRLLVSNRAETLLNRIDIPMLVVPAAEKANQETT